MLDGFGREIKYLRLSLTERCQSRCTYCSKSTGGKCIKDNELSAEDFILIAKACAQLGFDKIRFTGGEPLLRRDLCEIARGVSALGNYRDISITTNGLMLAERARELKEAGIMRCNVSLDSLIPDTYKKITGSELTPVLDGIRAAIDCSLTPLKINCVPVKGVNDGEIDSFIDLAARYPVEVRFIELMPMGDGGEGVSNADILASHPELKPRENSGNGPAVCYAGEGFSGAVGLISPVSKRFCEQCNRIRITSDGTLRACLGANLEFSLLDAIKSGDLNRLKAEIAAATVQKPKENSFGCGFEPSRKMNRIGG